MTNPRVLIVVPGTWWRDQPVWRIAYDLDRKPMQRLQSAFGIEPRLFEWPGGNTRGCRKQAAATLASQLREHCRRTEINLVGFSHGGNVAAMATQLACREIGRLITISTPVLKRYQPGPNVKTHIHLYNANDATQTRGGELLRLPYLALWAGPRGRLPAPLTSLLRLRLSPAKARMETSCGKTKPGTPSTLSCGKLGGTPNSLFKRNKRSKSQLPFSAFHRGHIPGRSRSRNCLLGNPQRAAWLNYAGDGFR